MRNPKDPCRCPWVDLTKQDYVDYHDKEWGVPLHDDRRLFEFLTLESAQAGLSWYTVLRKRAAWGEGDLSGRPRHAYRLRKTGNRT